MQPIHHSFILTEEPRDRRRNRIIIIAFIIFTIVVSTFVYRTVLLGLDKMNLTFDGGYKNDAQNGSISVDKSLTKTKVICNGFSFNTYIASNEGNRERGLSIFNSIKKNEAMLFVFDKPEKYAFWMKDMKFPIDIIWMDENGKIVYLAQDFTVDSYPNSIAPNDNSLYVLEFNTGTIDNLKIKIGNTCSLNFSDLK